MATTSQRRIPWEATGIGRLLCDVSEGLWPGEYTVTVSTDGVQFSTTASRSDVIQTDEGHELRVRVVERRNGTVVVRLPRETGNSGPIVEIPGSVLKGELETEITTA